LTARQRQEYNPLRPSGATGQAGRAPDEKEVHPHAAGIESGAHPRARVDSALRLESAMKLIQSRQGVLALLSLLAVIPGGCANCSESQRAGPYGEESENEAMQEYERDQEMRDSDL
jgi:hypothetical protein